jgi:hypothetical protein
MPEEVRAILMGLLIVALAIGAIYAATLMR